nr:mannose-6-phosphate isomerase, class I [Lentilactobacillus sp. SPB1-3]
MNEPLFMVPVLHEKIWGGDQLKKQFGYDIPSPKTGEAWGISAHKNGLTTIANGEYAGVKLVDVWRKHPELFADMDTTKPFPLMVKILDAHADLSIQVHPNDAYAKKHEGPRELGKTECWYVLSATLGASIYYGHTATTKSELREMVQTGNWQKLLKRKVVKAGDFIYVPSGTIHALGAGVVVLEPQRSSDTTYRLYDFDRIDQTTGKKRSLDWDKAMDVTTVPFTEPVVEQETIEEKNFQQTQLIDSPDFIVNRLRIKADKTISKTQPKDSFTLASVVDGSGEIIKDGHKSTLNKGDHFIIPSNFGDYEIEGSELEIVTTEPGEKIKQIG